MGATSRVRPLSLLFAENVLTDLEGNRSLIGLHNGIAATKFPVVLPRLVVYFLAESPVEAVDLEMVIRPAAGGTDVVRQRFRAEPTPAPTRESEFGFFLIGVRVPEPGVYRAQILQDGEVVIERAIQARDKEAPKTEEAKT